MPNFNDSRLIGRALESICQQSFSPTEVVVIDDGSTDNSIEIITECQKRFPIIRLVKNETNRGIIYSVNRALHIAQSDYLYFASANDEVLPGFFEKSMQTLAQYPQAGLCCTDIKSTDAKTGQSHEAHKGWVDEPTYLSGDFIAERLDGSNLFGPSFIYKRAFMLKVGEFRPELRWHCDWFSAHVLAFRHGSCYVPEPLAFWRDDAEASYCSGMKDLKRQRQVFVEVLKLMYSPDYQDIMPLVIKSRLLAVFIPVMSLSAIVEGLCKTPRPNSSASRLTRHLIALKAERSRRRISSSFSKTYDRTGLAKVPGIVANQFDQAYAQAFARFDKLRKSLRSSK
jgi:glycosyltransferase involved in cell wall biosynthesis